MDWRKEDPRYGRDWEGESLCGFPTNQGTPCSSREILGLEHCLLHVPDDMLDEAEQITSTRRCRRRFGEIDACRKYAVAGTEPPACTDHGANLGSATSKNAARRVIEGKMFERLQQLMDERGAEILDPPALDNPLTELLELAAEVKALKELLRLVVGSTSITRWRYEGGRVGEQTRAEVLLYERATERLAQLLIQIIKIDAPERLAVIDKIMIDAIEQALVTALAGSGADLDAQDKARKILRRELKAIEAHGGGS